MAAQTLKPGLRSSQIVFLIVVTLFCGFEREVGTCLAVRVEVPANSAKNVDPLLSSEAAAEIPMATDHGSAALEASIIESLHARAEAAERTAEKANALLAAGPTVESVIADSETVATNAVTDAEREKKQEDMAAEVAQRAVDHALEMIDSVASHTNSTYANVTHANASGVNVTAEVEARYEKELAPLLKHRDEASRSLGDLVARTSWGLGAMPNITSLYGVIFPKEEPEREVDYDPEGTFAWKGASVAPLVNATKEVEQEKEKEKEEEEKEKEKEKEKAAVGPSMAASHNETKKEEGGLKAVQDPVPYINLPLDDNRKADIVAAVMNALNAKNTDKGDNDEFVEKRVVSLSELGGNLEVVLDAYKESNETDIRRFNAQVSRDLTAGDSDNSRSPEGRKVEEAAIEGKTDVVPDKDDDRAWNGKWKVNRLEEVNNTVEPPPPAVMPSSDNPSKETEGKFGDIAEDDPRRDDVDAVVSDAVRGEGKRQNPPVTYKDETGTIVGMSRFGSNYEVLYDIESEGGVKHRFACIVSRHVGDSDIGRPPAGDSGIDYHVDDIQEVQPNGGEIAVEVKQDTKGAAPEPVELTPEESKGEASRLPKDCICDKKDKGNGEKDKEETKADSTDLELIEERSGTECDCGGSRASRVVLRRVLRGANAQPQDDEDDNDESDGDSSSA